MIEKELLTKVRHVALATVNEDGTPHNTPLFFIYSPDFKKFYMSTHPQSLHARNVERIGKGFAILYDSSAFLGGLYLTLENFKVLNELNELAEGMMVYNATRMRWGMNESSITDYQDPNERRLYSADIIKIEIYGSKETKDGKILNEQRVEVSVEDLLT